MNKKLLAAVIGAALTAPMAAAHAGVTVYGIANASVDNTDSGNTGTNAKSTYVTSSNSSRIGVKGSEDLGGGMKAIYQMEWGVGTTGGTDLNMRNRSVGLTGGFGTFRLGNTDTPMKLLWTHYDYNITHVGDLGNLLDKNGIARYQGAYYDSPKFGGSWQIHAAYQPNNGTADKSKTDLTVTGMAGPVKLGIGHETVKNGTGNNDTKTNRVSAKMKFGMLGIIAMYNKTTDDGGTSGHDLTLTALQGKYSMGGGNDIRLGVATAKFADNSNQKATMTTLGFDHHFSKKTAVYVDYATTNNKSAGTFTVDRGAHGGTSAAPNAGSDPKSISAGIIVKF